MGDSTFVLFTVLTKKEKNSTEFWKEEPKLVNFSKVMFVDSDLGHLDKGDYDLLSIEFDIKEIIRLKLEDGSYLIVKLTLEELWKVLRLIN